MVVGGLADRLMAPEIAEEAYRSFVQEHKRVVDERAANYEPWQMELQRIDRELDKAVDAILGGLVSNNLKDRMAKLEARQTELRSLLATKPPAATPL